MRAHSVLAFAIAAFLALSANAAAGEARLDISSKEAYDQSILAMVEDHDPAFARRLILSLLAVAASVPPALPIPEATATFTADPAEFYRRLNGYSGLTAQEIIAAAEAAE